MADNDTAAAAAPAVPTAEAKRLSRLEAEMQAGKRALEKRAGTAPVQPAAELSPEARASAQAVQLALGTDPNQTGINQADPPIPTDSMTPEAVAHAEQARAKAAADRAESIRANYRGEHTHTGHGVEDYAAGQEAVRTALETNAANGVTSNPANRPDQALLATSNADANAGIEATEVTIVSRQPTVQSIEAPNEGGEVAVVLPDAGKPATLPTNLSGASTQGKELTTDDQSGQQKRAERAVSKRHQKAQADKVQTAKDEASKDAGKPASAGDDIDALLA